MPSAFESDFSASWKSSSMMQVPVFLHASHALQGEMFIFPMWMSCVSAPAAFAASSACSVRFFVLPSLGELTKPIIFIVCILFLGIFILIDLRGHIYKFLWFYNRLL